MNLVPKIRRIEKICGRDVGRRINTLVEYTNGSLHRTTNSLIHHLKPRIAICTGFYIPNAQPPSAETDGPVGAAQLTAALTDSGVPVRLITDTYCKGAVEAAMDGTDCKTAPKVEVFEEVESLDISHFISIERAGPSGDGRVYNMRGVDITAFTPDIHDLYTCGKWTKIGIGDGGNEIGMGSIPQQLIAENIEQGRKIACQVPCDHLIVAGVSNWGVWALMAALALSKPEWTQTFMKYLSIELTKQILKNCVENGPAVDGVTMCRDLTIDGLEWTVHENVLQQINSVLK